MNATAQYIKQHMEEIIDEHRDFRTNEVSPTRLAESACDEFNDYEGENLDIPELYSELAVEVVEADDNRRRAVSRMFAEAEEKRRLSMQFFAPKVVQYEGDGDCLYM